MRLPFTTRRWTDYLETELERTRAERDDYRERWARANDQLIERFGYQPVTPVVRAEQKTAVEEVEKYMSLVVEDDSAGMLSEDVLTAVNEALTN